MTEREDIVNDFLNLWTGGYLPDFLTEEEWKEYYQLEEYYMEEIQAVAGG